MSAAIVVAISVAVAWGAFGRKPAAVLALMWIALSLCDIHNDLKRIADVQDRAHPATAAEAPK